MRRIGLACVLGIVTVVGCSSSTPAPAPATEADGGAVDGGATETDAGPAFSLASCTDSMESIYADPGPLPADLGAIIKCAKDKDLSAADIKAGAPNHVGKGFASGAHVYRVLYRTERGDAAKTPGTSSAMVYIPTTPRAATLPVIVASHGTVGQSPKCTPSKAPALYQAGPIVGAGFAVIAPDLAGYANYGAAKNPPNAYAQVADAAKSTLDGARALRKIMGSTASDKVVIVGHSQGGGTALGALALSASYGSGGTLAGVVGYAPLWLNQATWGALSLLADQYPFKGASFVSAVAIWYLYTHAELLDGAGHGGDPFKADKRAAIKSFVDTACDADTEAQLTPLGADIRDLFDPAFSASVALAAGLGNPCGDELCRKWDARFKADRPHLTGDLAKVPILLPYGGKDTTIGNDRMACVLDRLDTDKAKYTLCFEPETDHTGIVNVRSDYVSEWIAARTLDGPEPAACPATFARPACATPPPND